MEQAAKEKRSGLKTRATAIFIAVFIGIWLSGMTASLTAGACRNDLNEGAKKLRFCTISLSAGAWMKAFPIERAKGAIIHLERGIALHQGRAAGIAELLGIGQQFVLDLLLQFRR